MFVGLWYVGFVGLMVGGWIDGRTIVDTGKSTVAVRLFNLSDEPRTMRSEARVAKCSRIEKITGGSGSTDLPVQPDTGQNFGETDWPKGVMNKVTRSEEGLISEQVTTLHNLVGKNLDVFSLSPKHVGHIPN